MFRLGGFRVRMGVLRAAAACTHSPRKRISPRFLGILAGAVIAALMISSIKSHLPREDLMELRLATMRDQIRFLETMYRSRHEDVLRLQTKHKPNRPPPLPFEVAMMLKNISGTRAAAGALPKNREKLNTPFGYQLLPHLMTDANSLRPAYHMKGKRSFVNVVLGMTTVKRDKESYLCVTLTHLIEGLEPADLNSTLIVVFVGETDLEYVVEIAHKIEMAFPEEVQSGLIEVLSPSPSFYPKFDNIKPTLGDSEKRFRWRTKSNLDIMYLMAYVQTRGTYYLMLEDDVISKKEYMQEIKNFTAQVSLRQPNWFFIEYCPTGGIGKLFRSADLNHFITYVQLFYTNMPIDWLLESYLADRICTIDKSTKTCGKLKLEIRPKFKKSLFKHIGLYSSLRGKIQKVEDSRFGKAPTFYPHNNPRLASITTNIVEHLNHTVKRAYYGQTYFWGVTPKKGSFIKFRFKAPTVLEKFTIRSGNVERKDDRFYNTVVEVLPSKGNGSFMHVGTFDEFGLAEADLTKLGPINVIRIHVTKDSKYWIIISEIEFKTNKKPR